MFVDKIMYIIRIILIIIVAITTAIITIVTRPLYFFFARLPYFYYKIMAKLFLISGGVKVEAIYGLENLNKNETYLFLSNHLSYFDIPVLMNIIPNDIRFVYKKSMTKIPIFGWGMYAGGYIPINRSNPREAIVSLKKAADYIVKKNLSVVMFPEGTRSQDGNTAEFKRGMTMIAELAKCRIVPVSISGTYEVLNRSSLKIKPGKVRVYIDEPVEYSSERNFLAGLRDVIIANKLKMNV